MRLDHYLKIGNNDIQMAAILYSLLVIGILVAVIGSLLARSVKRDLANIELINVRRKANRDQRRNANTSTSEDELSLTQSKSKAPED
jgi:hypothetical protein